jgi:hypothetical protein
MWGMLLEQHPSHRTHSLRRRTPDLQPTTTLDNTPYCCNQSLTLLKNSSHRTHSLGCCTPDLQPTTTMNNTPYCSNQRLTLLKMGKILTETCWADWKINKIVIVASSWSFILFTLHVELWAFLLHYSIFFSRTPKSLICTLEGTRTPGWESLI